VTITLTTLGTSRRLIYHKFVLRVFSCFSVWVSLLLGFRKDLRSEENLREVSIS